MEPLRGSTWKQKAYRAYNTAMEGRPIMRLSAWLAAAALAAAVVLAPQPARAVTDQQVTQAI